MSDVSRSGAPPTKPSSFEIKSANLPLVALLLKTTDLPTLKTEWLAQFGDNPDFFDQDPLVIDLSPLAHQPGAETIPNFKGLLTLLRKHRVCPIAVKGGTPAQMAAALAAGLVAAPDVVLQRQTAPIPATTPAPAPAPVADDLVQAQAVLDAASEAASEATQAPVQEAAPEAASPTSGLPALVIDKPLRSGQQVYARGRDLVVMAMVNAGAEVIADGHIHVYAPLRGKAIAGARGNGDARIFALSMEAELVSIAGIYRTSDVPMPADVKGHAAMVSLQVGPDGDKLVLTPLGS